MLTGHSIYHVNQDVGKYTAEDKSIKGYYNDMTQKVLQGDSTLDSNGIPRLELEDNRHVYMPTMIFQYGLGAYDLYLGTKEEKYLDKFNRCVEWAMEHQEENGAWDNFSYIYPEAPYGAMDQGEGASLLLRAYVQTSDKNFYDRAEKALQFMLKKVEEGGCTADYKGYPVLLEYTTKPMVLNGWIFAIFGLYDMSLVSEGQKYKVAFQESIYGLSKLISIFDNGYWSLYNTAGAIASPFYHDLHIALLKALYQIARIEKIHLISERFSSYKRSRFKRIKAFIVKAVQKLKE